jgi:Squalene/phytoene synthase
MPASPERESGPRPDDRGSPRYFACLYAPAAQRELLKALFALEEEIAAAARQGLDHTVAHVRLEWWYEESLRAAKGAALHPLARAAHAQLAACGVPGLDLSGLIEVTRWDLTGAPFPTRSELDSYCAHWACAITVPVARCALPGEPALALAFGQRLGAALCELELIEGLALEAQDLKQHSRLRAELADCVALLGAHHQAPLRGLLVWAVLARRRSIQASRLADAWQAWRAARRSEKGRLVLPPESAR